MQKVEFTFSELPEIDVCGHTFRLKMSDADIFDRMNAYRSKYGKLTKKSKPELVMNAVHEANALIDEMLGESALGIIAGGRSIMAEDSVLLMLMIADKAAQSYVEKLNDYA